jgi:hypothetical protein
VLATARAEMSRKMEPALDALNASLAKLHEPLRPFPDHDVEMTFRLARPPEVSTDGIGLRLCAKVDLDGERVDPAITGPPLVDAELPELPPPGKGARIDVRLNAEAVNRIVYALWQLGELRKWGTSTQILDQLPDEVRSLAFEVSGFDPRLPPVLDAAESRIAVANVAVGRWGERTVFGHATGSFELATVGDDVEITAEVDRMAVSCATMAGSGHRIEPCLSELLPMVRERMQEQPPRFRIDTSGLVRALAGHTVHGLRLRLTPPQVAWKNGGMDVRMSVQVGADAP